LTTVGGVGLLKGVDWVAPLVGRRAELHMLTDVVTREPGPDVVVVVGEAGVGKSRLIGALVERAGAAGVTVLKGDCLPLTDSVPLLPVTEALRGLAAARPALRERCAAAVRVEVARLLPEWDTSPGTQDPGPVAGWQRGRLFSALRELLAAAAADGTCALLVEDLHWADASTLDFLAYLCAAGQEVATPVILTCREEETGPTRPIGRWITALARRHDVTRMPLGRLSRPEAAEQISGLLHAAPSPSVVDEVFARAGGNPFFTEQIVAAVRSKGHPELPESLAELLIDAAADGPATGWQSAPTWPSPRRSKKSAIRPATKPSKSAVSQPLVEVGVGVGGSVRSTACTWAVTSPAGDGPKETKSWPGT
jgi:hypothetical protein